MIDDVVDSLNRMKFSVVCFEELHEKGSYKREQARLMGLGLCKELEFCINQIFQERIPKDAAIKQAVDV